MGTTALLLSGGMDSTALAFGFRPDLAITIDYGQLAAEGEIKASAAVCEMLSIPHRILSINCKEVGSGDMAGKAPSSMAPVSEWWPFRNQLVITFAAALMIPMELKRLLVGTVKTDAAHADGTQAFFNAVASLLKVQEGEIEVEAPAIQDTTASLCRRFNVPLSVLAWSHSCHVSSWACGMCSGCVKHRQTMRELGHGEY